MRGTIRHISTLMIVVAGLTSAAGLWWPPLAQQTETVPGWSVTGGLSSIRSGYTATLLPNGKVLVAGGEELLLPVGGSEWVTNKAELYDPATGVWSPTGSLPGAAFFTQRPAAQRQGFSRRGLLGADQLASEAELYDPSTGKVECEAGWGAWYPYSDALAQWQGLDCRCVRRPLGAAGLYDPATETLSATGSPQTARWRHTATLLPNGKVLVAGGARNSDVSLLL